MPPPCTGIVVSMAPRTLPNGLKCINVVLMISLYPCIYIYNDTLGYISQTQIQTDHTHSESTASLLSGSCLNVVLLLSISCTSAVQSCLTAVYHVVCLLSNCFLYAVLLFFHLLSNCCLFAVLVLSYCCLNVVRLLSRVCLDDV